MTLNFVPGRPDIQQDKPPGGESPEYEAFELCGPNDVLVMSSVGPWESVGGDIKFLRLMQRNIGGLVTDGSGENDEESEAAHVSVPTLFFARCSISLHYELTLFLARHSPRHRRDHKLWFPYLLPLYHCQTGPRCHAALGGENGG